MWVRMRIGMPPHERSLSLVNQQQSGLATGAWPLFAGGALDNDQDAP